MFGNELARGNAVPNLADCFSRILQKQSRTVNVQAKQALTLKSFVEPYRHLRTPEGCCGTLLTNEGWSGGCGPGFDSCLREPR